MKPWFRAAFTRPDYTKNIQGSSVQAKSGVSAENSPLIALQLASTAHWTPRDYHALAREGYQRNAIAYRCIRLIAEAAASVPFCARRDGECVDGDPVQILLQRPNPRLSRAELFESHYGSLQLSGNAYIEAVLVDDRPKALFSLRPDRMHAVVGHDGWPVSWEYNVGGKTQNYQLDLVGGQSRIHHMRLFHPSDDIYGFPPLAAAAQAVDVHNAGGVWTKALLDNSARPSGALVYKGVGGADRLSDEQFERLKAELETNHSGARAAGRPLLLEGGLDWKAMSLSPTDMDFINARREAAREIALAFGVPPMLLGIPGDNTYANYKEANLVFWRQTILPLVRKTADSLGGWLQCWFGDDLSIHEQLDNIPVFNTERALLWSKLKDADFMSEAEKRELAGLPQSRETT
ncbi:MAG: phage portal protein [Robiginitomaculum sp.]|nr:MAG: phage portal protein [Robiginitomaculum sp.]